MINRIVNDDGLKLEDENGTLLLLIKEKINNKIANVEVEGKISSKVSHDFEDEISSIAIMCDNVLLNLEKVETISSNGFKALLNIQQILDKRLNTSLKLNGVGRKLKKEFEEIGFWELFNIEE